MKKRHAVISVLLSLVLVLGTFTCMAFTASADTEEEASLLNEHGLVENIEGGNILHCWCWNFNTIKENIPEIAQAGYSAVQTSPINQVRKGHNGGLQIYGTNGRWYYHYQPTNYTIGNYQLGTEAEFKAMCQTAHEYGVKVIVDVVANHTTTATSDVSGSLRYIEGGLYHNKGGIPNGSLDRYDMTQKDLQALPDCNTQNKKYQNVILNYLKQCVSDGADGFRFDAAKHIELPSDDSSYASDFWPTVLDNGSTFQYGEVLQSNNDHFKDYSELMHVTASTHGGTLRTYFRGNCSAYSASTFISYNGSGVKGDRLVTWVESHDTYANEEEVQYPTLSSFWLTNEEIRRGWAIIASRKASTSLFFNRPAGSQATTDEDLDGNVRWGNNKIGDAGDDNWRHPDVVAVNKFRNAMIGESEKLENINSKKEVIMITRGDRGAVIVNNSDADVVIDKKATTLKDGTYKDVNTGAEFIACGGYFYGTVKAKGIIVIYDDSSIYTSDVPEGYTVPAEPTTEATQATEATEPAQTKVSLKAAKSTIYVGASTTVTPTVTNKVGDTTFKSSNTKIATVTSAGKVTGKKAGTVTITAFNNGVSASVKIKVIKKNQTMTVKSAVKTVKYLKVKKSAQTVAPITVKNAKGTVKYKKVSGSAKLSVNSKGKIIVKKGTKKGTYTAVVNVTAAGDTAYNSCAKKVKVTVKVK